MLQLLNNYKVHIMIAVTAALLWNQDWAMTWQMVLNLHSYRLISTVVTIYFVFHSGISSNSCGKRMYDDFWKFSHLRYCMASRFDCSWLELIK